MDKKPKLFKTILPYVIISYILMSLVLIVVSLIYFIIPFSYSVLSVLVGIITVCLLFLFSKTMCKTVKDSTLLMAGIYGAVFMAIMAIIGMATKNIEVLSIKPIFMILIGFIIGFVGGTFGKNKKSKRRRVRI